MSDVERRKLIEDSERILADALVRHGFHGTSMNVVQILVKRDNEECDASTAIANLLFQYPQETAALRAEVARLTAENHALASTGASSIIRNADLQQQLATLTERLAAAERLLAEGGGR